MAIKKDDMSRRDFLRLTALVSGGLASGCWPGKKEPVAVEPKKTEYQKMVETIQGLGYEINEDFSQEVSGRILFFLPDNHSNLFNTIQKKRILDLDETIDFDSIGLEGLVGEIEPEREIGEPNKFEKSQESVEYKESSEALRKKIDEILDSKQPGSGRIPFVGLKVAWQGLDFSSKRWLSRYEGIKKDLEEKPRPTAPGVPYLSLETRARKIGSETAEVDQFASELRSVYDIQRGIVGIQKCIDEMSYSFAGVKKSDPEFEALSKAYNAYMKVVNDYVKEMKGFREKVFSNPLVSEDLKNHVLSGGSPHDHDESSALICDKRSVEWVKNAEGKKFLLVGGKAHTESVYKAAVDKGYSIITLK